MVRMSAPNLCFKKSMKKGQNVSYENCHFFTAVKVANYYVDDIFCSDHANRVNSEMTRGMRRFYSRV